jgi:putative CocE/NonD family hydrolase
MYITMRDGVRLAASMLRPATNGRPVEGRVPVIWHGGLDLFASARAANNPGSNWGRFVEQGYVVVDVARRGNGASFGVQRGYHDRTEAYDAYEITEWLAAQSWSSGAVGVYGCSNTGEAAMHTLSMAPPHLKAVWAGCFSWSKYDGFLRGGGIIANWGTGPTRTLEQNMQAVPVESDTDRALLRQAAEAHLKNTNLSDLLQSLPFRDSWSSLTASPFAYEGSVGTYRPHLVRAGVPLYIQGGWRDDFRREQLVAFANIPNARLIIGPWTHCQYTGFNIVNEALRFFDYHLKGANTGIASDEPIHYFTVGSSSGGEWRAARRWPGAGASTTVRYLASGDALTSEPPADARQSVAPAAEVACAASAGSAAALGPQSCHPAAGAVSFSESITRDTELTGHVLLELWVSSSATDANVFAYLEDVAPDGTVTVVSDARQKASLARLSEPPYEFLGLPFHRGHAEDATALVPGQPVRVSFDFLPVSYVWTAGHRLQITVTSADPRERFRRPSPTPTLTLHFGGERASVVKMPASLR